MISFLMSIVALLLGYAIYGGIVDRWFGPDPKRVTPAVRMQDGVDFVPLPWHKIFLIQFLNIAGLGPIFGAIMGALFGPSAFLWIVLGSIFAGGVHDYFSGMLSIRHDGKSIPEVVGIYLGDNARQVMRVFSTVLLVLVGVVFMAGPAGLLSNLDGFAGNGLLGNKHFWLWIIIAYYFIATVLPVDKLISKIYPLFGAVLLIMAFGVGGGLIATGAPIPELGTAVVHPKGLPIWPFLFITIACGAISGFHATQSPLMARCLHPEIHGRKVFYGSMIAEGLVALIWAAAAMAFFPKGILGLNEVLSQGGPGLVVKDISIGLMGTVGGMLAIIGVIACPITSGDTAFRSVRLIVADTLNISQKDKKNRLLIALPIFLVGYALTLVDFSIIWRYFAFANQALATIVLWTAAQYMRVHGRNYLFIVTPAVFMTAVCTTYITMAGEGLGLSSSIGYPVGIACAVLAGATFFMKGKGKAQAQNA